VPQKQKISIFLGVLDLANLVPELVILPQKTSYFARAGAGYRTATKICYF
jgi:hypothetical protein